MLKFTMNNKELKSMLENGATVINKKAPFPMLTKLYLQVVDGKLKVLGTDLDQYLELISTDIWDTESGSIGIDADDLKIITKLNGTVTITDVSDSEEIRKICIQSGKKKIIIPGFTNTDVFLPIMDETEEHILTMGESWLLETVSNLLAFTSESNTNKIMQTFNFDLPNGRVEALDGHRIGMRSLSNQKIMNKSTSIMLHSMCVPVLKKVLNKKSDTEVNMSVDEKYIKLFGSDFTYVSRKVDGKYFNTSSMLTDDTSFSFVPDKDGIKEIMKYNCGLITPDNRKPLLLHTDSGTLYSYFRTEKYETFDEVKAENINMNNDLYIGFNPRYLLDVFNIIDSENPLCRLNNSKSPLFVEGNEYSFLILPVNLGDEGNKMDAYIRRNKVA